MLYVRHSTTYTKVHHNSFHIEIVWYHRTSFDIAVPSFTYSLDEMRSSCNNETIGHQWYWVYEYSDYCADSDNQTLAGNGILFDSYLLSMIY
jgi:heme/copper-type cytochrome/quinol oxidase subunit 2